jgi:hypothetical protein
MVRRFTALQPRGYLKDSFFTDSQKELEKKIKIKKMKECEVERKAETATMYAFSCFVFPVNFPHHSFPLP